MKVRIYQYGAALQSAFSFPSHGDKIIAIDFRFRVSLRPHNNGCDSGANPCLLTIILCLSGWVAGRWHSEHRTEALMVADCRLVCIGATGVGAANPEISSQ